MAQAEIKNYDPNLMQQLRDWYMSKRPKNEGQGLFADMVAGPVSAAAYLTDASEQNDKIGQVLNLLGILPGMGGMIQKANVDNLIRKTLSGQYSAKDAKELTKVLNNPQDWKKNYFKDPKTGRNYFYGPDGTLREEVPDYLSREDRLRYSNVLGKTVFPTTYTPEEIAKFSDDVSGPFPTTAANTGSTKYYPVTEKAHVSISTPKKGIYPHYSPEYNKMMGAGNWDDVRKFRERLARIDDLRRHQSSLFSDSILGHELTHVGQFRDDMPTGGNTQESLGEMFKYLSPEDRARFKVGQDIFTKELTTDPLLAEIFAVRQPPEIRSKIQDVLYKNMKETPVYETVPSIFGDKQKIVGMKQEINKDGLKNALFDMWKSGQLKGADLGPIEDFFKLNKKGFDRYKANIGEVDARMGQARLLKAGLKNDPSVYDTHPYSYLDVPEEDIWWKDPLGDTTK